MGLTLDELRSELLPMARESTRRLIQRQLVSQFRSLDKWRDHHFAKVSTVVGLMVFIRVSCELRTWLSVSSPTLYWLDYYGLTLRRCIEYSKSLLLCVLANCTNFKKWQKINFKKFTGDTFERWGIRDNF